MFASPSHSTPKGVYLVGQNDVNITSATVYVNRMVRVTARPATDGGKAAIPPSDYTKGPYFAGAAAPLQLRSNWAKYRLLFSRAGARAGAAFRCD